MLIAPEKLDVVVPANWLSGPPVGQWTYAHYAALPEDGNRYELINGVMYMAPSPSFFHQEANAGFLTHLTIHVKWQGLGKVVAAPMDVKLSTTYTVQPDVVVVLNNNLSIITPGKIEGAPDLVVEISSPGTVGYDRREKQDGYALAGIKEYWIADPIAHTVELLVLEKGVYRSEGVFQGKALLPSHILPGLPVQVEQFFA